MRTGDSPHQPWVCLHKETADIYCAHCTCVAGLGETCSHIAAILFKVELGVRFGLTQKSVTSESCKWNQIFRKQVDPSTTQEIQHLLSGNRKQTLECIIPSSKDPLPDNNVLKSFYDICPDASFFSLIPPIHESQTHHEPTNRCTKPVKDPYPRTLTSLFNEENRSLSAQELTDKCEQLIHSYICTSEHITNLFQCTQNQYICPLWFEHRKGRVTGTKAHDILVRKESTPPENLVMRIMDYKSYNLSKKEAIKWGLDSEAVARDEYNNFAVKNHRNFNCNASGFQISADNCFMGATADGVISCECCGSGTSEIKCPFKHRNVSVKEAAMTDATFCLNADLTLKSSHRYYTQVQFQMAVYNFTYSDFVVMTKPCSRNSVVIVRIHRDDNFCVHLFDKCSIFIKDNVIPELLTRNLMEQKYNNDSQAAVLPKWCLCDEPEYGKMIACDNDVCNIGWFHYSCVSIRRKPRAKWFCPNCRK